MYNKSKNKILFAIFIIIILLIILILILSLYNAKEKSIVEEYKISLNNTIYDKEYGYVSLKNDAMLKKEWDGNYYLYENDSSIKYDLGTEPVLYDLTRNEVLIYGNVFQVFSNGEITEKTEKTVINSLNDFQFFKLNDRKYLIIGDTIGNGDFSTSKYLIVSIDKAGNATLLNDSVNMKTINPLILSVVNVEFDIANEKLKIDDEVIDLKKINGSTNEYIKQEDSKDEQESDDNQSSSNNNFNSQVYNDVINQIITIGGVLSSSNNKTNLYKNISLRTVNIGASYLDVSYSVIDPQDKYLSVFLSLEDDSGKVNHYYINKESGNYRITGLIPNTQYKLSINYVVRGDSNSIMADSIVALTSIDPTLVRIVKVNGNTLTYKVKMYNEYEFSNANVVLTNCEDTTYLGSNILNIDSALSNSGDIGEFTIDSNYQSDYICLKLDSVKDNDGNDIKINSYHKIKIK